MTPSKPFNKPPRFKVSGLNGLASHNYTQELPIKHVHAETLIQSHQIHYKASMLHGDLMLKSQHKLGRGTVHLFVDKSNSCYSFFKPPNDFELLIADLCQWLTRFGWNYELHLSESGTIAWNQTIWNKWFQSFLPKSDSIALVISDFHGQEPLGPFWKQLQSLPSAMLCWLRHPYHVEGNIDIDDPNQVRKELPENHFVLQERWVKRQRLIWKKLGLNVVEIDQAALAQVETQLTRFIS